MKYRELWKRYCMNLKNRGVNCINKEIRIMKLEPFLSMKLFLIIGTEISLILLIVNADLLVSRIIEIVLIVLNPIYMCLGITQIKAIRAQSLSRNRPPNKFIYAFAFACLALAFIVVYFNYNTEQVLYVLLFVLFFAFYYLTDPFGIAILVLIAFILYSPIYFIFSLFQILYFAYHRKKAVQTEARIVKQERIILGIYDNRNDQSLQKCFCGEVMMEKIIQLDCKHCFHAECMKKWIKENTSCPLCRKEIVMEKIKEVNDRLSV